MEEQLKDLTSLGESSELLEADQLTKSKQEEIKTTLEYLNDYTDIEKEKVKLEEEMKKFLLDNKEFALKMNTFKKLQDELNDKQQELRQKMTSTMERDKLKNESNGIFSVTYVAETERSNFDQKKLKEDDIKTWEKYVTKTKISASIKIYKQ